MSQNSALTIFRDEENVQPRKKKGGRPPKFSGPRRPVTITLPQQTLDQLAAIDEDRAQAIVKAVSQYGGWSPIEPSVQFVALSDDSGFLLVRSCQSLRSVLGLCLAEIVPGRYLLTFASGIDAGNLELTLGDLLETLPAIPGGDREVVEELYGIVKHSRRSQKLKTRLVLTVGIPGTI